MVEEEDGGDDQGSRINGFTIKKLEVQETTEERMMKII